MADSTNSKAPWYAAYPTAHTQTPATINRAELFQLIKRSPNESKSYVLVDMRRADHEVDFARSLKCPLMQLTRTSTPGWNNPRVDQSTCTESVPYDSDLVRLIQGCGSQAGDMVLRY